MDVGEAEARDFLARHFGRAVEPVEWVGEGAWSRCFAFVDGGREFVIRFGRHREDFDKDRRAAAFGSADLPVPHVYDVGRAFDGFYAISDRGRGVPLESLDGDGWRAVVPALFAALDAARAVDLSHTRGFGVWNRGGDAPHRRWLDFLLAVDTDSPALRTHGWRRRLARSPDDLAVFRSGLAQLSQIGEVPIERHLVHADLINRNVLVADHRPVAVFDWGCSLIGDFLYDIAWIEFWSPWFDALGAIDVRAEARRHYASIGLAVPGFDTRMRCCLIHIGLDHQAYNAHLGDFEALAAVTGRLAPLLGP